MRMVKIIQIGENSKIEKYLKERNERSDKGQMLSVTINSGIIKFSELDRKDNSSKDKSNYKVVRKNDIGSTEFYENVAKG